MSREAQFCARVQASSLIFSRVFEFALAEFGTKFAKMNAPQIFPLLQCIKVTKGIGVGGGLVSYVNGFCQMSYM